MELPIFGGSRQAALEALDVLVRRAQGHYVCFCEGNLLAHSSSNPHVLLALQNASMVLADGIATRLYARLCGQPVTDRYPGPTFILDACAYGLDKRWRHFFYGGAPGVADTLAAGLQRRFPGLLVAGAFSPPFRPLAETEEREVRLMIGAAKPHLLWVGLGGPKQELWMAGHVGMIDVPVMLGVGAAFDFHSGNRPWAPSWIRRIGMEWAYRALTGGPAKFRRNVWCVSVVAWLLLVMSFRRFVLRQSPTALGCPPVSSEK